MSKGHPGPTNNIFLNNVLGDYAEVKAALPASMPNTDMVAALLVLASRTEEYGFYINDSLPRAGRGEL